MSKALDVPKRIFAVLYVSVMGLTRCYKTTVFYIYICSFSTKFILQMYIIAQAYLWCCGVAKRMEVILEYYLRFKFGNRRH